MAKKTWAFSSRTMGTKKFDTYEQAIEYARSLNQRAIEYDGEAAIYKCIQGIWETYEEFSCY